MATRLIGCLLAIGALIVVTGSAYAQREGPRPGQEVRGIVKKIDAGAVTIATGGGRETPPEEKTFALAKDVEVCVGGYGGGFRFSIAFKEAKLTDISPGAVVTLSLSADMKTATSIVADEPVVRGVLKSADAKKNTISVTLTAERGRDGEPNSEVKTYPVAADADVAIDDGRGRRVSIREGKIDELAEGAVVTLRLSLDKKQVVGVLAEGSTLFGVIKSLDAQKRTMTITIRPPRGDDAGEERTVTIAKEAVVLTDDGRGRKLSLKEVKLVDVPVGSTVVAKLAVDQSFVMLLRAEGAVVTGLLKGVDADKGTITVAIPKSREEVEEKTLTLAKDARITLDGNVSKLSDLKPGENGPFVLLRLTLDQKMVQIVTANQPRSRE
jgi:hypothetical protein